MKKISLIVTLLLLPYYFATITAQQNSIRFDKKSVPLDSLSYIQLDKIIYYQTPLLIHNGEIVDNQFIPKWYDAFCVNRNILKFKDDPNSIFKYIHSSLKVSNEQVLNAINNYKPKFNRLPYIYFFGEVHFTHTSSKQKIIMVLKKENDSMLSEFNLHLPNKKNIPNEKLDSINMEAVGINFYIEQDGVVKFSEPAYIDSLLSNNSENFIKLNLNDFKDLLYRSKNYKVSNRENGKRKFATMEKVPNGFIRKEESDKP